MFLGMVEVSTCLFGLNIIAPKGCEIEGEVLLAMVMICGYIFLGLKDVWV
jgi:hypothetical protein